MLFSILIYFSLCSLSAILMMVLIVSIRHHIWKNLQKSPESRGLFVFHDGVRLREVDPIYVLNTLEGHPQYRFDLHPQRVVEGEKEAMDITVEAVRQAFAVPPFLQVGRPGLTNRECLMLLNAFTTFAVSQKKSTESSLTSALSTDATSTESSLETQASF